MDIVKCKELVTEDKTNGCEGCVFEKPIRDCIFVDKLTGIDCNERMIIFKFRAEECTIENTIVGDFVYNKHTRAKYEVKYVSDVSDDFVLYGNGNIGLCSTKHYRKEG